MSSPSLFGIFARRPCTKASSFHGRSRAEKSEISFAPRCDSKSHFLGNVFGQDNSAEKQDSEFSNAIVLKNLEIARLAEQLEQNTKKNEREMERLKQDHDLTSEMFQEEIQRLHASFDEDSRLSEEARKAVEADNLKNAAVVETLTKQMCEFEGRWEGAIRERDDAQSKVDVVTMQLRESQSRGMDIQRSLEELVMYEKACKERDAVSKNAAVPEAGLRELVAKNIFTEGLLQQSIEEAERLRGVIRSMEMARIREEIFNGQTEVERIQKAEEEKEGLEGEVLALRAVATEMGREMEALRTEVQKKDVMVRNMEKVADICEARREVHSGRAAFLREENERLGRMLDRDGAATSLVRLERETAAREAEVSMLRDENERLTGELERTKGEAEVLQQAFGNYVSIANGLAQKMLTERVAEARATVQRRRADDDNDSSCCATRALGFGRTKCSLPALTRSDSQHSSESESDRDWDALSCSTPTRRTGPGSDSDSESWASRRSSCSDSDKEEEEEEVRST